MNRFSQLAVVLGLVGCDSPDDRFFQPEAQTPLEVRPGLFRVTWNDGPDVVRGFTPDGARIVYQSATPGPGGSLGPPRLLSIAMDGGPGREEAGLYRIALRQPLANLAFHEGRRLLSVWVPGIPGTHSCLACPPPPTVVGVTYLLLAAEDGEPLSAAPSLETSLPVVLRQPGTTIYELRITPADAQARDFGVDPFRAAILPGGLITFFSDGEAVWRYDAARASQPDSLFPGAFVAISTDGSLLAVSSPAGLDSTMGQCMAGLDCRQTVTTITPSNWLTTIYDAITLDVVFGPTPGLEPVFAPDGRVLVRRSEGLHWVDPATGSETLVQGTEGGFAPAVFPDGSGIAFSVNLFGNADVFFMR